MKKIVSTLAMTLMLILAVFGCDTRFKLYSNARDGFRIKYPKTWQVQENADGAEVIFISPRETPLDVYSENLSIVAQDLKGRMMPLGEYTQEAIYQLTNTFRNIQVLSSSDLLLSGRPAHKFEYLIKGDLKIKVMHIWMLKGKVSYQITFGCDVDRCNDYMSTINEMIDSFELD